MKQIQGAWAGIILAFALAYPIPGKSPDLRPEHRFPVEPINLDIPPEQAPDPEFEVERELAFEGIKNPGKFLGWLRQLQPGRKLKEQLVEMAIDIAQVKGFRRNNPNLPDRAREAIAEHAILNPRFPLSILIPD